MNQWKEIQPKSFFQVALPSPLSNQDHEVLTLLYQPIIGIDAFSLYLLLLSEVKEAGLSETMMHSELLLLTDRSIKQIQTARIKLEAIGLVTTLAKKDAELGTQFVYRLNHPETARRFFKDEVLTLTLLNAVGRRKFDQLVLRFTPKFHTFAGFEDITAQFKDIYGFKTEQLIAESQQLTEIDAGFTDPRPVQKLSAMTETFDWGYFLQCIEKLGVQLPDTVATFKEEVYTFHNLFGINELEMVDFCSKAFDYLTNKIDIKAFEKVIYQTFDQDKKQHLTEFQRNEQASLSDEEQLTYRYNSLKLSGFSTQDIQMIMDSEQNFPLNYLEALKNARGGYTTPQERSLVKYLVSKSGLPNGVINILINYVYNIQKQPTLKPDYVNRIANEWAQSGIFSPEKAIEHVRDIAQKSKEQRQPKSYGKNNRPIRQEVLPDWVSNPVEEKKLSPERQAALAKELQELLNEEGD